MDSIFSGEEAYGKHLDLYSSHLSYLNLKGATRCVLLFLDAAVDTDTSRLSYIAYLDMLRHGRVERTLDLREKSLPAYFEYVQMLYTYLVSFFERALPLVNMREKLKEEEDSFASSWAAGQISGWAESSTKVKVAAINGSGIWCSYCTCAELMCSSF